MPSHDISNGTAQRHAEKSEITVDDLFASPCDGACTTRRTQSAGTNQHPKPNALTERRARLLGETARNALSWQVLAPAVVGARFGRRDAREPARMSRARALC
jgi:hypothetical protein